MDEGRGTKQSISEHQNIKYEGNRRTGHQVKNLNGEDFSFEKIENNCIIKVNRVAKG